MNYQTEKTVKIICIVLSVILTAALAFMIYSDNKKAKATEAQLSEIIERTRPYETEIRRLEKELSNLECYVTIGLLKRQAYFFIL